MKRCACCKIEKAREEFGRCTQARDGLYSYCRRCKAVKAKAERQRNAVTYKAGRKARYARVREQAIMDARAWAVANPERRQEAERAYRERNREQVRQFNRDYYKRHLEASRERARRHAHRRRGTPLTAEAEEYVRILAGDPCAYCGGPADTVDHIVAVAAGGDGEWTNLTAACFACNASKWTRPLIDHLHIGRRR